MINVTNDMLALNALLKQIELINDLLGRMLMPVLKHLHDTLENCCKYDF